MKSVEYLGFNMSFSSYYESLSFGNNASSKVPKLSLSQDERTENTYFEKPREHQVRQQLCFFIPDLKANQNPMKMIALSLKCLEKLEIRKKEDRKKMKLTK